MLLTNCTATGRVNECIIFNPIYVSVNDVFTETTARNILQHNKTGAKICDWRKSISKDEKYIEIQGGEE
jgi:hypothetical protein